MKKYDSIDLMKFIACICVVAIHTDPLYTVSPFLNMVICQGLFRLAVPLFFLASAFFLFQQALTWQRVKKYCKRQLILYAVWFIVSIPLIIYNRFLTSGYSFGVTIFRFVRSIFFTSTFSGSWFLVSCIFCTILFGIVENLPEKFRCNGKIALNMFAVVCYLLCVLTSAYGKVLYQIGWGRAYEVYEMLFAKPYTSIIVGVPYFALGRYLAEKSKYKSDIIASQYKEIGLSLVLVLCLVAEVIVVNKINYKMSSDCYLLLAPTALLIFDCIRRTNISLKNTLLMRNISTIVFFSQFIVIFILEFVEYIGKITVDYSLKFVITTAICTVGSILMINISNLEHFTWMKKFY